MPATSSRWPTAIPTSDRTSVDVTAENGTLSTFATLDGGVTWTATFTPNAPIEDASNVITLANSYTDLAGNAGSGAVSGNYAVDTKGATATVSIDDAALTIGDDAIVTITFSEAVTGFSNADVTAENGTLSTFATLDGGVTWTATFTPNAPIEDAINGITLANSYTDLRSDERRRHGRERHAVDLRDA